MVDVQAGQRDSKSNVKLADGELSTATRRVSTQATDPYEADLSLLGIAGKLITNSKHKLSAAHIVPSAPVRDSSQAGVVT